MPTAKHHASFPLGLEGSSSGDGESTPCWGCVHGCAQRAGTAAICGAQGGKPLQIEDGLQMNGLQIKVCKLASFPSSLLGPKVACLRLQEAAAIRRT